MCTVLAWAGKLPKGFMTNVLIEAEARGIDSTGLAFRLSEKMVSFRQAVKARTFVNDPNNTKFLGDARRSLRGIAHTRRASPGMPINNENAHPFGYWKYFFCHNGKIQNWVELKANVISYFKHELESAMVDQDDDRVKIAEYCVKYCKNITTDSMVIGPYIHGRDFSAIEGCLALVWMRSNNVYTFRFAKEAVATTVMWKYKQPIENEGPVEDHMVTIVGSTAEIIQNAWKKISDVVEYDMSTPTAYAEGHVFRVEPTGLVDEGEVPTFKPVIDAFSSDTVEEVDATLDEPNPTIDDNVEPPDEADHGTMAVDVPGGPK